MIRISAALACMFALGCEGAGEPPIAALTAADGSIGTPAPEAARPLGLDVTDLEQAFPPCELSPGDGRLDLDHACADGVCAGDTFAAVGAKLGEPTCTMGSTGSGLHCEWPNTLRALYRIPRDKAEIVPPTEITKMLHIDDSFTGKTADGLGIGVSMSCFLDAFGTPETIGIERAGERFVVNNLYFREVGIRVSDEHPTPVDGLVGRISLSQPKEGADDE